MYDGGKTEVMGAAAFLIDAMERNEAGGLSGVAVGELTEFEARYALAMAIGMLSAAHRAMAAMTGEPFEAQMQTLRRIVVAL